LIWEGNGESRKTMIKTGGNMIGTKGQNVVLWIGILPTGTYQQNTGNAMYSYQALCMHVQAKVPGETCSRLSRAKGKSEFPTLLNGDLSATAKTLKDKHRSSSAAGGWRRVDNPSQANDMPRNVKKK
jgi:hypothetical protein